MFMHLRLSQRWHVLPFLGALCVAAASCGTGGDVTTPTDVRDPAAVNRGGDQANAWTAMNSGTTELLWAVAGSLDNDVIAVGTRGTAIHLETAAWEGKATGVFRDLCDVWGAADGRAISVGTFGTVIAYDATQWSIGASGTEINLYDVWGFGGSDAFAVGDAGTILHFDGTAWAPATSGTSVSLFGVWGNAPANVFAVGVGGTILRYDGATWGFMTTPTPHNLSAVWGTGGDNVWAVGDAGTVLHHNGTTWESVAAGVGGNLYDVWGSSANDVWVVGADGLILHYDGAAWNAVESGTTSDLFGVWGRSANEAYAVGADGTVLRWGPQEEANVSYWLCHDHPDGSASPPLYGLRIEGLLEDGPYTFSFDYEDESERARVVLAYDEDLQQIRITGRAYGGRVVDDEWGASSRGWIDIDFTYTTHIAVKDDCGALAGDDLYVTAESSANQGTVALDGWGGDFVFPCSDRSGENNGCSFIFDNDYDSKGNAAIADDLSIWSASGWIHPGASGPRDWLFIAERITAPAE
jgi:hypothetical protein